MGNYAVIEKKNNDCFVIYDMDNKGMCCCSKYTVAQLIDGGSKIAGAKVVNGKVGIQIVNKDGKKAERAKVYDVPLTKRSAVTIAKGIKQSREERKKVKEVQEKRAETRKVNKKAEDAKKIEEDKKKAQIEKKKKQLDAIMKKAQKRAMRSKCIAIIQRIDIEAVEYDYNEEYTMKLVALSPAGLTAMRKLDKSQSRVGRGFYIEEDASRQLERYGRYETQARLRLDLDGAEGVQCVADRVVRIDYRNHYSDARVSAELSVNNMYDARILDCKGIYEENVKNEQLGASAGGGSTLNGYSQFLRRIGYLTNLR